MRLPRSMSPILYGPQPIVFCAVDLCETIGAYQLASRYWNVALGCLRWTLTVRGSTTSTRSTIAKSVLRNAVERSATICSNEYFTSSPVTGAPLGDLALARR